MKVSVFASIHRYQKLAYRESQAFMAAPQLHFHTHYGQCFTYKEIPLDVQDFTAMFHNIYSKMKNILEHDLLFDMTDGDLGVPMGDVHPPDDLGVRTSGYGLLGAERQSNWLLMKHIIGTPELWSITHSVSMHNPFFITIILKLIGHKFTSFILLDGFDGVPKLVFSICLECEKSRKCFTFLFHRNSSFEFGVMIYK